MRKIKLITGIGCACICAGALVWTAYTQDNTFVIHTADNTLEVNGESMPLSAEIFSRNGAIYIPADDFLPKCSMTGWDAERSAITVSKDDVLSYIYVNSQGIERGGEWVDCEYPTLMYNDTFYIPLTMFAAISDDSVYLDGELVQHNTGYRDLLDDTYITDEYRLPGGAVNYKGTYVVGGSVAMEQMAYTDTNGEYYAGVVNAVADALPNVQVYDLLIPTMSEFYGPRSIYTDQISGMRKIYHKLDEKIIPINAVKTMWEHADEKLYFSTDHHWTQRGAYYAYKAFMENKGETVPELWQFPQQNGYPFIGSFASFMSGTAGAQMMRNNPEVIERFMPIVEYSGANYHDMYLQRKISTAIAVNTRDNTYTAFVNGDQPLGHYITSIKNGKKLVIVKESFGDAFATWALNNYEEVFVLDPRYWNGFGGHYQHFNLTEFYNNICQFDDLIIVSYPGSTTSSLRQAILKLVK